MIQGLSLRVKEFHIVFIGQQILYCLEKVNVPGGPPPNKNPGYAVVSIVIIRHRIRAHNMEQSHSQKVGLLTEHRPTTRRRGISSSWSGLSSAVLSFIDNISCVLPVGVHEMLSSGIP